MPASKKTEEGYALFQSPALRALRGALDAGEPVSLDTLSRSYRHSNGGDLYRIKLHEKVGSDLEATRWLLHKSALDLGEWLDIAGDTVTLKQGFTTDDLRFHGRPVLAPTLDPENKLNHPFSKIYEGGTFKDNIRAPGPDKEFEELCESMQAFGWIDHHPAIIDENDVVIVGHRRLKAAAKLKIEPKVVKIRFGHGDEGDVERVRLAIASNLGGRPLNKSDRKKIAVRLLGDKGGWTVRQIGELLQVSKSTIADDLRGCPDPDNLQRPKGGRPRVVNIITKPNRDPPQHVNIIPSEPRRAPVMGFMTLPPETVAPAQPILEWWLDALARAKDRGPVTKETIDKIYERFHSEY